MIQQQGTWPHKKSFLNLIDSIILSKPILIGLVCFPLSIFSNTAKANPDWSEGAIIPQGGRANIYELKNDEWQSYIKNGKLHTQIYPVEVTGILAPYKPIKKLVDSKPNDPFRYFMQRFAKGVMDVKNFNDVLRWVGMNEYPLETDTGIYSVPYPNDERPDYLIGFSLINRTMSNGHDALGFTISCAECHSSRLFGKTVLGLTNRFPKANETFVKVKKGLPALDPLVFQMYSGATEAESEMVADAKKNLRSVAAIQPLQLGLDTSLAQVSLSLNMRNPDGYATKSKHYENFPRPDMLDNFSADSKPAVWWNLKYKNRWLSDGSVVSGNPIFTNILWNEIGRGVDLKILEKWLDENDQKIRELTSAVFSIEAPRITDFFPAENIDLAKAQKGQVVFENTCARCHGHYDKAWDLPIAKQQPLVWQLQTIKVRYPQKTQVKDVGTDSNRYLGMKSLEKLNDLTISKNNNTVIKAQVGYVPPPLVGIWSRWPYLHNNSIPNLCALLTRASDRPQIYYAGAANDQKTDFDFQCNGYPLGDKTPDAWKKSEFRYNTKREGMHATGHDEGIFIEDGKELLSVEDKMNLITYLQTL